MADATLIDAGTRIDGRIAGDGDVTVRGRVDGEIALSQRLVVADGGFVQGTVEVAEIVVDGALEADVVASELIVLSASARVVGSLTAPAVRIEDGAQFSGEVVMDLDA
ncbi:MAG: bactofilin family protein, partial [Persicimonas sp.]